MKFLQVLKEAIASLSANKTRAVLTVLGIVIVSHDIRQVLIELKSNHIILMATHLLQLAVDISDEIYLLKNGAIIHPPFNSITNSGFEPYIMEALKDEA